LGIPCGSFVLDCSEPNVPVVLLSGGVGVTPMMSMLEAILDTTPKRPVTFIQSVKGPHLHHMKKRVEYFTAQHDSTLKSYAFYSQEDNTDPSSTPHITVFRGRMTKEKLREIVPRWEENQFYYCGPLDYQRSVNADLRSIGVQQNRIHYEAFGPAQPL
jgi:nitric oxide dioxygenase